MEKRTITMSEILKCSTWSKKDNSPRGCSTVSCNDIKPGDKVVYNNYFTEVIDGSTKSTESKKGENKMKKSNTIKKEIENIKNQILEAKKENEKINALIIDLFDIKKNYPEGSPARRELIERRRELNTESKKANTIENDLKIKEYFLISNYRAALFNELLPGIIETLNNYSGKKHGEKTCDKINSELSGLSENRIYAYNDRITIYIDFLNYPFNSMDIYFSYNTTTNKRNTLVDTENRVNKFDEEMFNPPYKNRYYNNISVAINQYKKQLEKINELQHNLESMQAGFNSFIPDGLKEAKINHSYL